MTIETKFDIGDKVRRKVTQHVYTDITCPFCNGKEYIESNGKEYRCEMCENGIYEQVEAQQVWSSSMTVIGAAIKKTFPIATPKVHLCVEDTRHSLFLIECFPEDEFINADEVKEGDIVWD